MRAFAFVLFAFFLLANTGAKAASFVVVQSDSGTSYSLGDLIDDRTKISLSAGAELTLISSSGTKLSIKGPFNGVLGGTRADVDLGAKGKGGGVDVDVVKSLAMLFKSHLVDGGAGGVFRSLSAGNELSDPWMLDSAALGHFCYAKKHPIMVWRRPAPDAVAVEVQLEGTNEHGTITWAPQSKSAPWPLELPVMDGASYLFTEKGKSNVRRLILHAVPDDLPTLSHQAAWMADQKCSAQAVLLVVSADIEVFLDDMVKKGKF